MAHLVLSSNQALHTASSSLSLLRFWFSPVDQLCHPWYLLPWNTSLSDGTPLLPCSLFLPCLSLWCSRSPSSSPRPSLHTCSQDLYTFSEIPSCCFHFCISCKRALVSLVLELSPRWILCSLHTTPSLLFQSQVSPGLMTVTAAAPSSPVDSFLSGVRFQHCADKALTEAFSDIHDSKSRGHFKAFILFEFWRGPLIPQGNTLLLTSTTHHPPSPGSLLISPFFKNFACLLKKLKGTDIFQEQYNISISPPRITNC